MQLWLVIRDRPGLFYLQDTWGQMDATSGFWMVNRISCTEWAASDDVSCQARFTFFAVGPITSALSLHRFPSPAAQPCGETITLILPKRLFVSKPSKWPESFWGFRAALNASVVGKPTARDRSLPADSFHAAHRLLCLSEMCCRAIPITPFLPLSRPCWTAETVTFCLRTLT